METLELTTKDPAMETEANSDRSIKILSMLAQVVHERRSQLGMTQDRLAELTGLHRTYISDIERGARNLSVRSLVRLSEALKIEPSVMLEWAEKKLYLARQPQE